MKIQVLYFAVFRERLGKSSDLLELPTGAQVADAIAQLEATYPIVAELRGRYRAAVNQHMVMGSTELHEGDELVLIPPVAGGQADEPHVVLSAAPLSLDRCLGAVSWPGAGGIATFTGLVREHSHGHQVLRLEYEAYAPMAIQVMRALIAELRAELPTCRIAVEHRVGVLAVGDIAVVIAASAPHRAEAFAACRAMIDRLKESVPIWKKEIATDGAQWMGLGP
jgi:molybdopterin synthase catalytic subunit